MIDENLSSFVKRGGREGIKGRKDERGGWDDGRLSWRTGKGGSRSWQGETRESRGCPSLPLLFGFLMQDTRHWHEYFHLFVCLGQDRAENGRERNFQDRERGIPSWRDDRVDGRWTLSGIDLSVSAANFQ